MNENKVDPRTAAAWRRKLDRATAIAGREITDLLEAVSILRKEGVLKTPRVKRNMSSSLVSQAAQGFESISEMARALDVSFSTLMQLHAGRVNGSKMGRVLLAMLAANPKTARRLCVSADRWLKDGER